MVLHTFYLRNSRLKFTVGMYIENKNFSLNILICTKCEASFINIAKNISAIKQELNVKT